MPLSPRELAELIAAHDASARGVLRFSISGRHGEICAASPEVVRLLCEMYNQRDLIAEALTTDETPTIQELTVQRDEADRRAGAAERELRTLRETESQRTSWLSAAKREAGYDTNVSFDVVWRDALAALLASRRRMSDA